jgi:hypothetical protein
MNCTYIVNWKVEKTWIIFFSASLLRDVVSKKKKVVVWLSKRFKRMFVETRA